jgi:hypothetical protein
VNRLIIHRIALSLLVAASVTLTGCAALGAKQEVVEKAEVVKKGPQTAPHRSITSFSAGLRCMDNHLIDYGVRDVSVIVEDILDKTTKVSAGTKDMLISAVSDMTKRSRGIRLIAFGSDSGNTIGFLQQAQNRTPYAIVPQYGIRGSVSQFDDAIVRKNADGGIAIEPYLGVGLARTAQASMLGLDLTVLSTEDLSVIAGASARNSVIIFKEGRGFDTEAAIRKFGINYSVSVSQNEGQSQALRTLVELAAIELFGKLVKVPYWTCLGAGANDETVKTEIQDWYEAMRVDPSELVSYFQNQLRQRRLYNGPVDGAINPEIKEAVAAYREALGLSREPKLSLDFFRAYLSANHSEVAPRVRLAAVPVSLAAPASAASAPVLAGSVKPLGAATVRPLSLRLETANRATQFKRGQLINLIVSPSHDAHVYCYLRDENRQIKRFYPNRFARDSRVSAAAPITLPGAMRFQIVANERGLPETVACFATERDVMPDLPVSATGVDFEALPLASLDQLQGAFTAVTGSNSAQATLAIRSN